MSPAHILGTLALMGVVASVAMWREARQYAGSPRARRHLKFAAVWAALYALSIYLVNSAGI